MNELEVRVTHIDAILSQNSSVAWTNSPLMAFPQMTTLEDYNLFIKTIGQEDVKLNFVSTV
jgi:hypothetical protein